MHLRLYIFDVKKKMYNPKGSLRCIACTTVPLSCATRRCMSNSLRQSLALRYTSGLIRFSLLSTRLTFVPPFYSMTLRSSSPLHTAEGYWTFSPHHFSTRFTTSGLFHDTRFIFFTRGVAKVYCITLRFFVLCIKDASPDGTTCGA